MSCIDYDDIVGRARRLGIPASVVKRSLAAHRVLSDRRSSGAARKAARRSLRTRRAKA